MRWLSLLLLGGCHVVFGLEENATRPEFPLESTTHDEDGDGVADAFDPCPHRTELDDTEFDGDADGIGDRCDPRPDAPDVRTFIAFENGDAAVLTPQGVAEREPDALLLGTTTGDAQLVFAALDAGVVDIEVDVEITAIKTLTTGEYAEVGLFAVHRDFTDKNRGDNCFYGADATPRNFLEFNNDDDNHDALVVNFGGTLPARGQFSLERTPELLGCAFATTGITYANRGPHEDGPRSLTGKAAVSTHLMQVRFYSFWLVTPRL